MDTKQLEEAAKQIDALGTAVNKLNKPMQQLSTNSEKAADASAKVAKATAAKVKADEKAVESTSKLDSLLEKLNNRYIDMSKGSTSAEAGVLQLARSLGATTESALKPYKDILENIRELSKSPFDSAIGSVRSITQEYDSLTYRAELASKGIFLTTTQLKEYSRIANEIKGKLKAVDLDPTQGEGLAKFNTELKAQQDIYLGLANKVNTLKAAEKDRNDILNQQLKEQAKLQEASDNLFKFNQMRQQQEQQGYDKTMAAMRKYYSDMEKQSKTSRVNSGGEMDKATEQFYKNQAKAQKDAAKAAAYVADVELRLAAALSETNKALDKQSTDALVKYEKALRQTGLSSDEAAAKLANVKKQFEGVADKKQADRLQYLARAISVQMGDVGISLASGMNPLLVMIQQGDQIRGAIQQAGASGKELEGAMAGAATQIATSFLQTGQAIGGFFVNAVKSAGKAIVDLPLSIANSAIGALAGNVETSAVAFDRLKVAAMSFGKVGIITVIATLAALAIEYVKVTAAEKELTKSLAMSGAALGMSTTDAITYAESMNKVGIGTMDAMRMISEFANTGADASIPLEEIIESAQDMQKYVGIASADTMKAFADIAKKPVEGLIDLAKSTGNVTAETILQAEAFVKAGNNAEAARIAQLALRDSNKEVARRMKNDLDPLQTLWMDIKSGISKAGEALYDFLKSSTMVAIFRTAWETIAVIVAEVWYVLKATGTEISGIASQIKAVMSGDFAGAAKIGEDMKVNAKIARDEQDKLVASIMNRNKAEKETLTITEDQRKANRNAAKEIEDRIKKEGKGTKAKETKELTDLEKERIQFLKTMSDLEDRASGFTKNYSDQLNILNIGLTEGWLTQDEFNMKLQELNKVQPGVIKAHKDNADALEKFTQAQKKADDALFDSLDVQHQLNMQVLEQTDLLALEGSLIGATDSERKKALATKRLDLQLEKEIAAIKKSPISASEQADQIARAIQRRLDAEKNLNTEIANDAATKTLEEYNKIKDGIADSIVTALFEGGKAGSKKLRDLIVAELKKPITIVVKALVDATLGSMIQSFVGGSSGDAIGSFAGSATGSAATGGLSGITIGGATLGAQAGAFGAGVANGFGPLAGMQSGGLATSTSYNLGATYGAPAAGVLAGVYGGRAISGGYSAMGGASGNSAVNIGTAAGAAIGSIIPGLGTALGAAVGGALGGAFNRTFGRKLTGIGIEGTLGGETSFEGNRYTFEKGGFLRSNKYTTSILEEADRSAIASDFRLIKTSVLDLAKSAGFATDAVENFTQKFAIDLMNLSPEDATKKYQEEFAKIEESMAKAVIGTSGYRRENETNVQALTRISTVLGGVNTAFEKLGFETYKLEVGAYDAAQGFIDLFGGIEGFNKAMGFFYDNFFTQEEKTANLVEDLTKQFGKLGFALPSTREEFKKLVQAAKLMENDLLVKNLTDLQYAFAELVPLTEELTNTSDNYARSLIEAQRISAGAGAYTEADFLTKYLLPNYTASDMLNTPISLPALNATTVNTAMDNSYLIEAVNAVKDEIAELRYEVQADVIHNAKTATILTRVVPDGQSLNVTAAIDGGVV